MPGCTAVQYGVPMRSSFHVVYQCAKSKVFISNTGAPFNVRNKEHTERRIPNHAASRAGQRTQAGGGTKGRGNQAAQHASLTLSRARGFFLKYGILRSRYSIWRAIICPRQDPQTHNPHSPTAVATSSYHFSLHIGMRYYQITQTGNLLF